MSAVPDNASSSEPFTGLHVVPPPDTNRIGDIDFVRQLKRLRALRAFLYQTVVEITPAAREACRFGALNQLRLYPGGRPPTLDEWHQLEERTQTIWETLPEASRRQFLLGEIPWWVSWVIGAFAGVAIVALFVHASFESRVHALMAYTMWLVSLGGIGAVSFIAMNALSVQDDATFDLGNSRLIVLRIALGALLSVVIALPFGFDYFIAFKGTLNGMTSGKGLQPQLADQALWLLLPLVLGFSTSLVVMVLNRFVEAVQTFFGKVATVPNASPTPKPKPPTGPDDGAGRGAERARQDADPPAGKAGMKGAAEPGKEQAGTHGAEEPARTH